MHYRPYRSRLLSQCRVRNGTVALLLLFIVENSTDSLALLQDGLSMIDPLDLPHQTCVIMHNALRPSDVLLKKRDLVISRLIELGTRLDFASL